MSYAANTKVTVDKSRAEIERTLQRYGASSFAYGWDAGRAMVQFVHDGRQVRFTLPMPDRNDRKFTITKQNRYRSEDVAYQMWEQACRQRWRALALVVKAKLEAVDCGITTFEDEFLAHLVLPNGSTVGEWTRPQLEDIYNSGRMPELLPGGAKP